MIKILSIDGGGIRGIIPAVVLAEIEKQTGKPEGLIKEQSDDLTELCKQLLK